MAGLPGSPEFQGAPDASTRGVSRRRALGAFAAAPLAVAAGRAQRAGGTVGTRRQTDDGGDGGDEPVGNTTTTVANPDADAKATPGRPAIRPRADWGSESPPNGTLRIIDDDLLIVHHTDAPEGAYQPSEVPTLIQAIFNFQTSGDLAWPDIGFNFIVDEFGTIWEGRQGSIDAPIACETEGGDPGHTQHVAFLGQFSAAPPTPLATEAMVSLLAWLANRDGVATQPGDLTNFISEGSDKFPAGEKVTVRTIAGHREIADVGCPGDPVMNDVVADLQGLVNGERARLDPAAAAGGATATTAAGGTGLPPAIDEQSPTSGFESPPVTRRKVGFEATPLPEQTTRDDLDANPWAPAAITGGVAAAALGAGAAYMLARRRANRPARLPQRSLAKAALASAARQSAEERTVDSSWALVVRPDGVDGGSAGWIPAGTAAVGWAISAGWSDDSHDLAGRELRSLVRVLEEDPAASEGRAFGDAVTAMLSALVAGTPGGVDGRPGSGPGAVMFLHGRTSTSVVVLGSGGFVLPGEEQRPEWARVPVRLALPAGAVGGGAAEVTTLARRWDHAGRMPVAVAWLGPTGEDEVIDTLTTAYDAAPRSSPDQGAAADDTAKVREAMLQAGLADLGLVVL